MTIDTGQTSRDLSGVCNSTPVICAATRHGTITTYKRHGCRCTDCRQAWAVYNKAYQCDFYRGRRRQVAPETTRGILGALWADGWSFLEMGRRLGVQAKSVSAIVHGERGRVSVAMQRAVVEMADDILGWPGPSGKARSTAKAHGWTPNLLMMENAPTSAPRSTSTTSSPTTSSLDVDPVAVDRFLGGDWAVPLNTDERFEIYRHLVSTSQPMSKAMQDRLAINGRRTKQFRARLDAATVTPAADTHANNDRQEASA